MIGLQVELEPGYKYPVPPSMASGLQHDPLR